MKTLYLLVNFFTILVPFLFSFHPRIRFYRQWKYFFTGNVIAGLVFIAWDVWFTHLGVWGFNPKYVTGIYLANLPVEEILFFTCIPFSCIFTYYCLTSFYTLQWRKPVAQIVLPLLIASLLLTGFFFHNRWYTSVTFISLACLLFLFYYVLHCNWITPLISAYGLLLVPFFIVNGILTGTGPDEPVVWYNNTENLHIRLLTIPLEDVFYGFELILLNAFFFEWLRTKNRRNDLNPNTLNR